MNNVTKFARLLFIALLASAMGCSIIGKAENDYIGNAPDTGTDAPGDTGPDVPDTIATCDGMDCSPAMPHCDEASGTCVECEENSHCETNNCVASSCADCTAGNCGDLFCDGRNCVECIESSDCSDGGLCAAGECQACAEVCEPDSRCEVVMPGMATEGVACVTCDDDMDGFPREACGPIASTPTRDSVPVDCDDNDETVNPRLACGMCAPTPIFGTTQERHGIAQRVDTATTRELKVVIVGDAVHVIYLTAEEGSSAIQDVVATLGENGTFSMAEPIPVTAMDLDVTHPVLAVDAIDAATDGTNLSIGFIEDGSLFMSPSNFGTRDISEPALSMFPTSTGVTALGRQNPSTFRWIDVPGGTAAGFTSPGALQFDADGDSVAIRFSDRIDVRHRDADGPLDIATLTTMSSHAGLVATVGNNRILLYVTTDGVASARFRCDSTGCSTSTPVELGIADLVEGAYTNAGPERFAIASRGDNNVSLHFLTNLGAPLLDAAEDWPTSMLFGERLDVINDVAVDVAPVTGGTLVAVAASGTPEGGAEDEIWMTSFLFCE